MSFFSNKFLLVAVIVTAGLTLILPYLIIPGTGMGLWDTVPIANAFDWMIVIVASLSGLLILPEIFYGRKIWRWE